MNLYKRIEQILSLEPEHIDQVEIRIDYFWALKNFKSKKSAFFKSRLWNAERRKSTYALFRDKVLLAAPAGIKFSKNKKLDKAKRNAEHNVIVWGKFE